MLRRRKTPGRATVKQQVGTVLSDGGRESSRPLDEDIDDIGSLYGHLRQAGSPEQKYGSQAIEARLDKLTSMIERLSKTNGPLDAEQRLLLAQNVNAEVGKGEARPGNGAPVKSAGASRPGSPRRTDSNDEFPIPAGLATDLVDPIGSLNLGHLSLEDGGRSRYVTCSLLAKRWS